MGLSPTRLILQEHEASEPIPLSPAQLSALAGLGESVLRFVPGPTPGHFRLRTSSWVGEVAVPDLLLSIRPKVEITSNLLYMLMETRQLPRWLPGWVSLPAMDGPFELLAWVFLTEAEKLVKQGLHRAYRLERENQNYFRGRIVVSEQIRSNLVYRHRLFCEYSEHTPDVIENQVLAYVVRRLLAMPLQHAQTRRGLRRLQGAFSGISDLPLRVQDVQRIPLSRLTERYRMAHSLAAVLMQHLTLEQGPGGGGTLRAFLLDMNKLYEKYISVVLGRGLDGTGLTVEEQAGAYLDVDRIIRVVPDLVVKGSDERPVLVADVKYKAPPSGAPVEADLYQVLAYCGMLQVNQAALIYAEAKPLVLRVRSHGGNEVLVHVLPFPLSGSRNELDARGAALAQSLVQITNAQNVHRCQGNSGGQYGGS